MLPDAEEPDVEPDLPVVEPDFLEVLLAELPDAFPVVAELDFDVVDLEPDDDAFVLLPLDEVEEAGEVPELPMLEVLPMSDDPVLPIPDEPELLPEEEPDVPVEV